MTAAALVPRLNTSKYAMLPKHETIPEPSASQMPLRVLPVEGESFIIHSASITGRMPMVESTWLWAGDWISSAISFERIAQIPHVKIVANVQPSHRTMASDYSKTSSGQLSCAKCLSICAKCLSFCAAPSKREEREHSQT